MKRLLTLVAFFATVQASAQQVNPVPDYVFRNQMSVGRNAVTDTAAYFSIGPRYGANKGFMPPIVGDTATFSSGKRNGLLIFSVQKNKFLYWDSVRVQWSDMAGSSGSYITGSGITGYLPQFSASTTLDTSALFTLGNRLGIGSSTFAYNSTNTANVELNGTAGGILGFKRNDSARGYLWHTGDNMELANTAAGSIFFNTNSATRGSISSAGVWRLHNLAGTGDRVVVASSNGTLSAASSATALVDTTTISTRAWRQKGLDSLAALEVSGSGTTNYVPKFTAGSTIGNSQIFDNGTNVGLGTASPGAKFHLLSATGTAQTQGDYANNVAIMQGASRTGTTSVGGSFATTLSLQSNDDVITAGSGASIGFAAKWNTGLYSSAAQFASIFGGKENSTDANLAGYLSFATRPAGGNPTERLRITSDGDILHRGTYNPLSAANRGNIMLNGSASNIIGFSNNSALRGYIFHTDSDFQFYNNTTGGRVGLYTEGTARLWIQANGRVGINTTTDAGYQLNVNGTFNSGANYSYFGGDANTAIYMGSFSNEGRIGVGGRTSFPTAAMTFYTADGTNNFERMRISSAGDVGINQASPSYKLDINGTLRSVNGANFATTSGNVGIGIASPLYKMHVFNTAGESSLFLESGTTTQAALYLANANNAIYNDNSTTNNLKFFVNSATRMTINSSGNVGIGTTSPLAVTNYTGLTLSGTNGSFTSLYTGASQIARIEVNTTSDFTIKSIANVPLIFGTNNTENARINSGGELLINTTTDAGDYKLQVSGNALVTAGKLDITTNTGFGLSVSRSGTSVVAGQINNSNGILYYGAESSTGGGLFTGSSAYAAVIGSGAAYPLQFATDNVTRATINTNGELLINTLTDNGDFKLQVNGSALISGSIQTANPVSGTAVPWRLGSVVATNVQLDTGNYVEVNINGTFYRLAIVTPL